MNNSSRSALYASRGAILTLTVALVVASSSLAPAQPSGGAAAPAKAKAPTVATEAAAASAGPIAVSLVHTDAGYELLRGGKKFFIRGVGGEKSLPQLVAAGGNSIRTWGADKLGPTLDEAHKQGLTVAVGIWLGHARHGFDYANADQVAKQYEDTRKVIEKYKDHPAVLLWGLGNEMEGYEKGDNAAIWSAVNNLAIMAKKLDPNHPTMTVVAEIGGDRVKNIHRLCPDIDIVGINSYGGAATLPTRYKAAGGTKPYIVTEFGPAGIWETKKNSWGATPEPTSTEKAESYRAAYRGAVAGAPGLCLGSYAFLWGNKQEATATWFGMLLPDGTKLAAVDVMTELWSGKPPKNRCPTIKNLKIEGDEQVEPLATVRATLEASDPDGDKLKVTWTLQGDATALGVGGDAEAAPPVFADAIVKSSDREVELKMPKGGGAYRLFARVDDGSGAAIGNVLIRVKGPQVVAPAREAKLPFVVYDEDRGGELPFVPSGYMGNAKAIKLDPGSTEKPHSGKTCLRVEYSEPSGWGGVVWQHPERDWGEKAGGWNLTGAKKLTFWARGETGGEVVTFEFGVLDRDKRFFDTAKGKVDKAKLTTDWQQFSIDLAGKDLSRIKTGFVWVLAADGKPVTFYLDDIAYE